MQTEIPPPIAIINESRRKVRELIGMTLDQLSALVGCSKSALSKWECGIEPLSADRQVAVDRALRRALAAHALQVCAELDRLEIADLREPD